MTTRNSVQQRVVGNRVTSDQGIDLLSQDLSGLLRFRGRGRELRVRSALYRSGVRLMMELCKDRAVCCLLGEKME